MLSLNKAIYAEKTSAMVILEEIQKQMVHFLGKKLIKLTFSIIK